MKSDYNNLGNLPLLTLNMTGSCNLKCPYCHTNAGKKDPDEMNSDEYKNAIDQAVKLGAKVVWIGGKGEPTIDPAFKEVVKHVDEQGLPLVLNTNGTLIDKDLAKFMHEHHVYPEVRIISFDEKEYDWASGVSGYYPKMREGLDNLLAAGYGSIIEEKEDSRITDIAGMMLLAKPVYKSIPGVLQYCKEHNLMPSISDVVASGRVVKNKNLDELKVSKDEVLQLHKKGSEIMGYPLNIGIKDCEIQYGMYVQNNGDILATRYGESCDVCDYFGGKSIGNIKEMSLKNGWEILKKMREENKNKIEEGKEKFKNCKDCLGGCYMTVQSQKDYYKNCGNQK